MTLSDITAHVRKIPFLILILVTGACHEKQVMFRKIDPGHSNITFNNRIVENDSINQLDIENVYNGGGAGIGDFNNDDLPDIFLTGNLVESRLYLNEGDFVFRDITSEAGISTDGRWCRGVSVADVNNDGWKDIYVSVTLREKPEERISLLYINKGLDKKGIPEFSEEASAYGLDDRSHSTQAVFFDYDNDEDLDVYIVVNEISDRISPYLFHPVMQNGKNPSTGKLYRNDWNDSLGHPVYTDVSAGAGIQTEGYGHQASITDINHDGWLDIYVSNDFFTNDLLWINNGDGTFTDRIKECFKHTSANSMGNDIGDINNDGLQDVITLDMNPGDNYRKKMMLPPNSYQIYQNYERFGYSYQYVRNTLQLNQGSRPADEDSTGLPLFSETGYYAGITETDWSWSPMLGDFDNDGFRDLVVCNGFPRDITDHDFATFRDKAYQSADQRELLMQIPEIKLHNYVFRNNGDLTFSDVSLKWGMATKGFSNGAAWADLDRDGDLDLVINNINDEASLYRNNARELKKENAQYLRVRFRGAPGNINGFGAVAEIFYDNGKRQVSENNPFRSYISSMEDIVHFGLGNISVVDSLVIYWPGRKKQVFRDVRSGQVITTDFKDAAGINPAGLKPPDPLFTDMTRKSGIDYYHAEEDFIDFNIQKLIPRKFSEAGPALAAGDIDGNGLDDLVCGGSAGHSAQLFLQQKNGTFRNLPLLPGKETVSKSHDDGGILVFDSDNDNDNDLYIASCGYENDSNSPSYQDHLYINTGNGVFIEDTLALPRNHTSKSCVRSCDFDKDGDADLFIAGRVDPWNWPKPVSSQVLRNDSGNGKIKFTDVTDETAPFLIGAGLICDALFTDFDNDGWSDLVLAGDWMPVIFLKNVNGVFRNITDSTGLSGYKGWWNSIVPGDFDKDGDTDYVLGNLGLNSFYRANHDHPVSVYAADFDNNGSFDAFPSLYLRTSHEDTTWKEFPVHTRDDAIKQMISLRNKFKNYKSYAVATIDQLFSPEQLSKSLRVDANYFKTSLCRNEGNNKFTLVPLPAQAQFSVINGMVSEDFNGDGNPDLAISGNDWSTEVSVGRYDAMNGLLLYGDGKGGFIPARLNESGLFIPGNGRALIRLRSSNGNLLIAASQNRGPLRIFELKKNTKTIKLNPDDASATIKNADGTSYRTEFNYGSSFLSQSSRFINLGGNIMSATITDIHGRTRNITRP